MFVILSSLRGSFVIIEKINKNSGYVFEASPCKRSKSIDSSARAKYFGNKIEFPFDNFDETFSIAMKRKLNFINEKSTPLISQAHQRENQWLILYFLFVERLRNIIRKSSNKTLCI